jgi:hypothetical protein
MSEFVLGIIFISAGMSLISYIYCWQEVRSGTPHILALRQITSIMDRNSLNQRYGKPDLGYNYTLTEEQVDELLATYRSFFLRECATEITCMFGVWRYMTGAAPSQYVWLFIALAVAVQGVNLAYSMWLIRKWRDQLQEETDSEGE